MNDSKRLGFIILVSTEICICNFIFYRLILLDSIFLGKQKTHFYPYGITKATETQEDLNFLL